MNPMSNVAISAKPEKNSQPKMEIEAEDQGDFRYAVDGARVPWHAVGETFHMQDVAELVRFLMPRDPGADEAEYAGRQLEVTRALQAFEGVSRRATKLTLGQQVKEAETIAAQWLGVKHASLTSNWTAGMETAYKLSGLRPGDEVIVPPITFIATIAYPLMIGARVVFADIDPATLGIDPEDVRRKITPKTRMVVPVHIGGYACDMDPLMEIAAASDLYVMEDAAHALGATYKGRMLGTIGHFGGYSFHEVKNMNALGEGGLLVTDLDLGEQFAKARFLGLDFTRSIPNWLYDVTVLEDRYGHPHMANNSSVTEIQALGFKLQFNRLAAILEQRRRNSMFLRDAFAGEPVIIPPPVDTGDTRSSHHLFPLRVDPSGLRGDIQALKTKLKEKGVTEIAHFGPLYKFEAMRKFGYDAAAIGATCPQTEEMFNRAYTHLPLYPLTQNQLAYMAEAVLDAVGELKR
jgi:perosamine synthetase